MLRINYERPSAKELHRNLKKLSKSATVKLSDELYCGFIIPDNNILVEQADYIFVKIDAADAAKYLDSE
ncbi:hypothetical protein THOM_0474 [Trachipleistophora hominis]|uniref:Uncharacterized protein n=1 Tax=Trachipleistophora hominis TaxID=72359 RepID=L7JZS5_TRAHO|nr:hypothetical protein THOM_0474 [Trachipleistophora hominis]